MRAKIPIAIPPGTRLMKIEREPGGYWMIWLHTRDFIYGTYLKLYDNGSIERVTVRECEGDEVVLVKPEDKA